ncbi:MAG: ThiF family adenylyltransferase [Myxococcales bacterium]|nr:ThiF family adenylyltransferase [Myxococcales bacterium]
MIPEPRIQSPPDGGAIDAAAVARTQFVVLGAGGLGCPALLGLVAAGARRVTLVDDDVVDASNLQRQVLYETADVGMAKTLAAESQLRLRARDLRLTQVRRRLDARGLAELLEDVDPAATVLLECSDDPGLKFAANDLGLARGIPTVIAGVQRWRGQIIAVVRGAACYRCLYEAPPPAELAPACSAVGIIGAAAGLFGHWMALLAVRLASARADVRGELAGSLHALDLRDMRVQTLRPRPRPGCPACAGEGPELDVSTARCAAR